MQPSPLERWTLIPCCHSSERIVDARYGTIEEGMECVSVSARTLRTEMASRDMTAPLWVKMAPAPAATGSDMSSPPSLDDSPRGGS
eukprot:scaffold21543_cov145-Skeletonema_menzelii.AAC.8